ncbi:MAG: hypothetical protein ACFNTM_03925, partial [Cardiobacterium sp.]
MRNAPDGAFFCGADALPKSGSGGFAQVFQCRRGFASPFSEPVQNLGESRFSVWAWRSDGFQTASRRWRTAAKKPSVPCA